MTDDAVFSYMTGQLRPHHADLLAAFEAESATAVTLHAPDLDVRYASHPRACFDFFRARMSASRTMLYFHAGYWQARDKRTFRFFAPALLAQGWNVALVNYPLCPDVDLMTLVATTCMSAPAVLQHAGEGSLMLAGHSAGAHLAIEILLADNKLPISGALAISGVYDLEPLVTTPLNGRLGLDVATARAHSPLYRVMAGRAPVLFVVGESETGAFHGQNVRMGQAWAAEGNAAQIEIVRERDHFSILRDMPALVARAAEMSGIS